MRIDKFLKVSRLIKRRTVANEACDSDHVTVNGRRAKASYDASHVSVNGKQVKASYDVKVGDIIEVSFGEKKLKVRVTDVKEVTRKNDAQTLYEVMPE